MSKKCFDIRLRHIANNVFVKRQYRYLYAVRIVTPEKPNKTAKREREREREREKNRIYNAE